MKDLTSRREFLSGGLAVSATGLWPGSPKPSFDAGNALRHRSLGRTGLKVTAVGFGCVIMSDPTMLERAADLGINHFDTSRTYMGNNSERIVGATLRHRRKDLIISSKVSAQTTQEAMKLLEESLRELQTDYLDIWYLAALSKPAELTDERMEALEMAKRQGKIRFSGVTTHEGQTALIPAVIENGRLDVLETSYNFTMEERMTTLIESAAKAGVGVVAMKVMAGGSAPTEPKKAGAGLAALKWALKSPSVHCTVVTMRDAEQLEEDLRATSEPFTEADAELLAARSERIRPFYCRMCGRCEGSCRQGLPVADILRFATYADGYGEFRLGRDSFQTLGTEVTGVRCSSCPACTVECPHGVRVAERLSQAQRMFA